MLVLADLSDQTAKQINRQTNLLLRYFQQINWDSILATTVSKIVEILFFSLLFWLINRVGRAAIRHGFKSYQGKRLMSGNRVETIQTLSDNAFKYFVLFFYLYAVLSVLGVPVGTLLTGAGILGLALGLGAQGFVNDVVTGFFILLEGQFDVGDSVQIGTITGTISSVGLRTTIVESTDGTQNYIPNRNIGIVSNRSRNNMLVLIKLPVFPTTDLTKVKTVISQVNADLTPKYDTIVSPPEILGMSENQDGSFSYQVQLFAQNGEQVRLQREFLAAYLAALHQAGIDLPTPRLTLTTP